MAGVTEFLGQMSSATDTLVDEIRKRQASRVADERLRAREELRDSLARKRMDYQNDLNRQNMLSGLLYKGIQDTVNYDPDVRQNMQKMLDSGDIDERLAMGLLGRKRYYTPQQQYPDLRYTPQEMKNLQDKRLANQQAIRLANLRNQAKTTSPTKDRLVITGKGGEKYDAGRKKDYLTNLDDMVKELSGMMKKPYYEEYIDETTFEKMKRRVEPDNKKVIKLMNDIRNLRRRFNTGKDLTTEDINTYKLLENKLKSLISRDVYPELFGKNKFTNRPTPEERDIITSALMSIAGNEHLTKEESEIVRKYPEYFPKKGY
jgi:hypothetical protein